MGDSLTIMLDKAIAAVCAKGVDSIGWADALAPFMQVDNINTPARIAAFVGQVAWESTRGPARAHAVCCGPTWDRLREKVCKGRGLT